MATTKEGIMEKKILSKKHEKFVAEKLDGKLQMASGAIWFAKADVYTDKYLIECKATEKDYYTLKTAILDKIESEALKVGKIPLLCFRLKDKWGNFHDYVCVNRCYVDVCVLAHYDSSLCYSLNRSVKIDGEELRGLGSSGFADVTTNNNEYVVCEIDFFVDYVEDSVKW